MQIDRRVSRKTSFALLLLAPLGSVPAPAGEAGGEIYTDAAEHRGFQPHQLAFELPDDGLARGEAKSQRFYAIILKSAPVCTIEETERLAAQEHFAEHKVFSSRFECENDSGELDNVRYTDVNDSVGFLAVYAGSTKAEAKALLEHVQTLQQFPGANIRRMRAVFVFP